MAHIFFDIDDTLFPSTEFANLARKNAINAMISMGLDCDYDEIQKRLSRIISKKGSNYTRHFDDLCTELKIKDSGRFVAAAIAAYHDTKTAIQPFPTVPLTLYKLKEKGHKLYVATNGNSIKQWDKLIRLRIAFYFERVFVSQDIGAEKGPDFYKKILKEIRAKPEDCVMVGDREDFDIKPAKNAGMATVRVLSGKYSSTPSKADFVISEFSQLLKILEK